jgi:uncharacterized membrane protein YkvA (DUF1232 family)
METTENDFKDFYDVLTENLESYQGEYASFIDHGPLLFKLLTEVLNEKSITRDLRLDISAAIAYYVVPMDVIPEQIYGPYGYIDDIYVTVYVIKKVADVIGYELLSNLWEGKGELQSVVDECHDKALEVLEDKKDEILVYVGLI